MSISSASQLPTRLFRIDPGGTSGTTIDTKGLDPSTEYYTVSHVWGANYNWYDIPGVPWKVPATSKDKITFIVSSCSQQKYDYIWCDIFCIRQGENDPAATEDQKKEMPKMAQYYGECKATIVFGDRYETFATRWSKVDALLETWEKDREGKQPQTREDVWKGLGDIDAAVGGGKEDQWFWRVWTLQETLLPPYLLTSNGIKMRVKVFCELIDWTYIALSKGILNNDEHKLPDYPWIHPRAGVVNDNGWWMLSSRLELAFGMSLGHTTLDPLQALALTAYRQISSRHPKDALFAAYGLIDSKWHVEDKTEYTWDDVWRLTVAKYIEGHDLAPLLAMAVTDSGRMTWAAGKDKYMGSVIPTTGKWKNSNAKMDSSQLQLTVPGARKIKLLPNYDTPYGDGSGELSRLLRDLRALAQTYDISSIIALLVRAIKHSGVTWDGKDSLESVTRSVQQGTAQANSVSSGLRAVFNGWDRWIVANDTDTKLFLAWFPDPARNPKKQPDANYWLLWSLSDENEWAAVVEGDLNSCKKQGIAFTNFFKPPSTSESKQVVVL